MEKVNNFILELESLRVEMGEGNITDNVKVIVLERKQKELKKKDEQLQEEIQREIEDFFDYLSLKQGIIETLNSMDAYIQEETRKVDEIIKKIKVTEVIKGA